MIISTFLIFLGIVFAVIALLAFSLPYLAKFVWFQQMFGDGEFPEDDNSNDI